MKYTLRFTEERVEMLYDLVSEEIDEENEKLTQTMFVSGQKQKKYKKF